MTGGLGMHPRRGTDRVVELIGIEKDSVGSGSIAKRKDVGK